MWGTSLAPSDYVIGIPVLIGFTVKPFIGIARARLNVDHHFWLEITTLTPSQITQEKIQDLGSY
jgi:hypothetical protein